MRSIVISGETRLGRLQGQSLTIARGTVPLAIFGPIGYRLRTGILGAPARATQAFAPFLFGLLLDRIGTAAISVTAGLCILAVAALFFLKARAPAGEGLRAAS